MFFRAVPPRRVIIAKKEIVTIFTLLLRGELIKGNCVESFESKFADYLGVKFALAVSSGRLGLKLILESLNLEKGDEVLLPAYTFHIVPEVIRKSGFTPVFVDINEDDYNIGVNYIERKITPRTKVIIATHLFGKPCELSRVMEIAKKHNIFVIEDCAQAIGAKYQGREVGSFGDCAYFSFESIKPFHTFGGGMIVTDNRKLYEDLKERIKKIRYPRYPEVVKKIAFTVIESVFTNPLFFTIFMYPLFALSMLFGKDIIGLAKKTKNKFKLLETRYTNFQAATGLIKLETQAARNKKLNIIVENLLSELDKKIITQKLDDYSESIFYCFVIRVNDKDYFYKSLFRKGIIGITDFYVGSAKDECPVARKINDMLFQVPIYADLTEKDARRIAKAINACYKR